MTAPQPIEWQLLGRAESMIDAAIVARSDPEEAKLQLLEAVSARLGGAKAEWLYELSGVARPLSIDRSTIEQLVRELNGLPMPPALALSALARPSLDLAEKRKTGAYYTDFRLAKYLVDGVNHDHGPIKSVLDPACGTGILLAACAVYMPERLGIRLSELLAEGICGSDLSPRALRGARLALCALTRDRAVVEQIGAKLRCQDSLRSGASSWLDTFGTGFDLIVANPPWEKLKISRHEALREKGIDRHYGETYDQPAFEVMPLRSSLRRYIGHLEDSFELQGSGEHDLYKLFCELAIRLLAPGGQLGLLLPAGLIRSQGTRRLREHIVGNCARVDFTVMENRARFFAIDTRFKFLALHAATLNGHAVQPVKLSWTKANDHVVERTSTVTLPRSTLRSVRPDLSLPEVRSVAEWKLFVALCRSGIPFGDRSACWRPQFMREVDMTRDSEHFARTRAPDAMPLIEGRMVHQFRFAAKRYVSGTGRRALWEPEATDDVTRFGPQFFFPRSLLPRAAAERVGQWRVGFCDITGQTNERTLLASRIPANVVCGNKVPTILFQDAPDQRNWGDCWLGIVNSFVFDWIVRRVVTTTVNYFLLLDLPMPPVDPRSPQGNAIAAMVNRIYESGASGWKLAELRAELEARVLEAYGQPCRALALILDDFPLLDRSAPPLPGESRSTVTRDLVLLRAMQHLRQGSKSERTALERRVEMAREAGAIPFIPSHFAEQ